MKHKTKMSLQLFALACIMLGLSILSHKFDFLPPRVSTLFSFGAGFAIVWLVLVRSLPDIKK